MEIQTNANVARNPNLARRLAASISSRIGARAFRSTISADNGLVPSRRSRRDEGREAPRGTSRHCRRATVRRLLRNRVVHAFEPLLTRGTSASLIECISSMM